LLFWSAALFRRFFSFVFKKKSKSKRRKSAALQKKATRSRSAKNVRIGKNLRTDLRIMRTKMLPAICSTRENTSTSEKRDDLHSFWYAACDFNEMESEMRAWDATTSPASFRWV